MDEVSPKKSTTLSVDRAAFLLLRVKKAFKKKRHLRKEKPTQLTTATLASQSRSSRKIPPPLLRSRTLPAIVVPGIPVVSLHLDNFSPFEDHTAIKTPTTKWPTQPKTSNLKSSSKKSLMLPNDDISLGYRRKSSDNNQAQQKFYDVAGIHTFDGLECHPDGSVVLRIPAPHVVAARAYRLPSAKQSHSESNTQHLTTPSNEGTSIASSNCCAHTYTGSSSSATTTALTRFVKLLHQTGANKTSHSDNMFLALKATNNNEAPRRLSWERRKDSSALQRSASIDSVAEAVWCDTPRPSLDIPRPSVIPFNKRPSASSLFSNCSASSQNTQLNINYNDASSNSSVGSSRRESLLSPSSTRRNKTSRIINNNVLAQTCNDPSLQANCLSEDECSVNSVVLRSSMNRSYYLDNSHNHKDAQHRSPKLHDRWSEQLTNLISVARPLRAVNSCTPKVFKEMEFLIPHTTASEHASTIPTSSTQKLQSSSLSISRQSRGPCYTNMPQAKNAKLQRSAEAEEVSSDENVLSVSRQPMSSSARGKSGNTPHRNKMTKKQLKQAQAQLEKFTQINEHLHALFSAVEHGHLEKARTILESTDLDVNSINSDGLSALDVAVLSNNRSMTKMLLQHGALGGSQFSTESIGTKLNALLKDAESRIHDLSGSSDGTCPTFVTSFGARASISSIIIGNTGSSVTGCTGNETDKQIGIWERRVKGLRRMLLGWDQARPPDAPASVTVDVTGINSITVQVLEPFDGAIGTKFKVQWSTRADFSNIVGERDLIDWTTSHGTMGSQCHINGLTQGRRYFIRAMCGNVKGWGPAKTSVPACIVPSSWRDLNNHEDRYLGRQKLLDNLFTAVRLARPADVSELTLDSSTAQRRNPKKKTTIKQLFSVASRFQKNLRRGIYLASTIYCEDKVLVTSEDFLPVIEIDEAYPATLHSDYHWLMKVACSWEDVKSLRSDMERNLTSAVHFRTKLLSAVCQMQSALGLIDLGTLYYKTFRDSHGTVVLTCVQAVRSQKAVSILNSRWLPVNKLQKKIVAIHEDYTISEMLISSIGDQIHYHQASMKRLEPGLYLGYLKLQCSVEQIQVVVPVKTPNVLPHCKVRDNSHINAEEWQVLKRKTSCEKEGVVGSPRIPLDFNANSAESTTEVQRLFLYDLATAAQKLLAYMNIRFEDAATHRLYDVEIIEHSKDISVLVICPSVELTCAAPGQPEILLQRDDLVSLSIQAFEMIHLRTYQSGIIQKYSRLSCILELDTALANHSQREAFSTSELQTAKERLAKLHELTANLNTVWKCVRWLMDVIAFARDKNAMPSVAMHEILEFAQTPVQHNENKDEQKDLLQLPIRDVKFSKSGSGRGSWPGPAGNAHSSLVAEHSKSEQNLDRTVITPNAITPNSDQPSDQTSLATDSAQLLDVSQDYKASEVSLRKNSGDSVSSEYTTRSFYSGADSSVFHAIPPSRSADVLSLSTAQVSNANRKRTSSNTSSRSSQPLPFISVSNSVPQLASKSTTTTSTLSLKAVLTTDFDVVSADNTNKQMETRNSYSDKTKAASSVNLREGGLYLRSTLNALQTEIKSEINEVQNVKSSSTKSLSQQSSEDDSAASGSSLASEQGSGIIQVYTAYNTGLASGTSLKLHVTPKTSAREVINLVVKQLNMAAVLKGNNGPIYTSDMLDNFCLVAVIGARERCLRDDFKPLQLQNPWKKGRLYVRQKHELLAAIEHSNKKSQLI